MRRFPGALPAVAMFATSLTWTAPGRATTLEPLSMRQLVSRATAIVEGTAVSQRVLLQEGRLWTESLIRVSRRHALAGDPRAAHPGLVRIRQLGGADGKQGLYVAGVATFAVGERVLIFARPLRDHHVVVGGCLGKYTIFRDRAGVDRVRRQLSDVSFAQRDAAGRLVVVPAVRLRGAPQPALSQLRATISRIVSALRSGEEAGR